MSRLARSIARRLATLAMLVVVTPFCVSIDRGTSRTTLTVDAEYGHAYDYTEVSGCASDETSIYEQAQDQYGGRVSLRYEDRGGFNLEAQTAAGYATRRSSSTNTTQTPVVERYGFFSLGAEFGYDWQYVGASLGVGFATAEGTSLPLGNLALRLGDLTSGWFTLGAGLPSPPFDSRTVSAGPGFTVGPVRIDAGAALLAHGMVDVFDGELFFGSDWRWGGYATAEWRFAERFGLDVGVIASTVPSARLGLLIDF